MPSADDQELETLIRARYPIIYVLSWEEKRIEDALRTITANRGKRLFVWSVTQGLVNSPYATDERTRDPMAALDAVMASTDPAVFLFKDFHAFINDFAVTRRLRDLTLALKTSYKTLVMLSPTLKLPPELTLVEGQSAEQPVEPVGGQEYNQVSWRVKSSRVGDFDIVAETSDGSKASYRVKIKAKGIFD